MRWSLQLCARYDASLTIRQKHELLFATMEKFQRPWGLEGVNIPEPPDPGSSLSAIISLTKLLRSPVISANVIYAYRADPNRNPGYHRDDIVNLDFSSRKITADQFKTLVRTVIPAYVSAFQAYKARLGGEKVFLDYICSDDQIRLRKGATCLYPVNYWDNQFCRSSFGKSPGQILSILSEQGVDCISLDGGVYVVFSDEIIPENEQLSYERCFWDTLKS